MQNNGHKSTAFCHAVKTIAFSEHKLQQRQSTVALWWLTEYMLHKMPSLIRALQHGEWHEKIFITQYWWKVQSWLHIHNQTSINTKFDYFYTVFQKKHVSK